MADTETNNSPNPNASGRRPAQRQKKDNSVTVLIVEDNPQIRRVIEIFLIRRGFEVIMASDGQEGVQTALNQKPDLILLDLNLPIMSGFDVIKVIKGRKILKDTPVLAITALQEREKVIKAISLGFDDYLIKPITKELLFERIEKALSKIERKMPDETSTNKEKPAEEKQEYSIMEDIKDKPVLEKINTVVEKSDSLIALPFVISKVLKISQDESAGAKQLAMAIQTDAAITAVVLRRANSAYYGARGKIKDVADAVIRMGFKETRSLVLGLSFMKFFSDKGKQGGLNHIEFWKHGLAVAAFSRILATAARMSSVEVAFTAGLLHDLGKVIFAEYLADDYTPVFNYCVENDVLIRKHEEESLGATHQEVGCRLAEKWQLPEEIVETIKNHHSVEKPSASNLAKIVHLADALAKALGIGNSGDLYLEKSPKDIWDTFDLKRGVDQEFTKKVYKEIAQSKEFLDISDAEMRSIMKKPTLSGEVLFADFTGESEHIVKAMIRNIGYRIRNISDHKSLDKRLEEQARPSMFVVMDEEKDVDYMMKIGENPIFNIPRSVLCFANDSLVEKLRSAEFPFEWTTLPCSSAKAIEALGTARQ